MLRAVGLVEGHRALITGGGSGIGRAVAHRLTEEGAAVAVLDRDGERAAKVAAETGGVGLTVDVTDADGLTAAVDRAAAELGGLSIVHANAGIGTMNAVGEMGAAEWASIIGVNLTGVYHTVHAALPHLLANGDGRIVCTSSISGVRPADAAAAAGDQCPVPLDQPHSAEHRVGP